MATVHLLRHGHVENPQRVLYGRLDGFHLSDTGRKMARAVALDLTTRGVRIDALIASPLTRAQETAQPIARAYGLEIATEPRVIEAGNSFEGQPLPQGAKDVLKPSRIWSLRNPFKPSWGEPYKDIALRMLDAIRDAATENEHSLIVSHQLPIWVARRSAEGGSFLHDPRNRECALASLTSFTITDDRIDVAYCEPAAHIEVPT